MVSELIADYSVGFPQLIHITKIWLTGEERQHDAERNRHSCFDSVDSSELYRRRIAVPMAVSSSGLAGNGHRRDRGLTLVCGCW
jgi:hypothetical protein